MGFQFWIPFFARSHFQLPNKMSIFKRRWILVKPSQFAFSIFPIFQTQMNIIIIWTIICMRILQPQTESGPRTYFFLFCSCFFPFFFRWTISFTTFHSQKNGPVFITSRSLRCSKVGFVYFLTLLGMVVDLLRDFLNAAGIFCVWKGWNSRCVRCVAKEWWTGWWFGTCFIFHILGIILPTDFHIFQRARYTTNQLMLLMTIRTRKICNDNYYW